MNKETLRRIHLIYGAVLGVVTVVAGICLIVQCLDIYRSGPYTRQAVAEHFAPIAVPIYLCLALVIGGFILKFALPNQTGKSREVQRAMVLANLHARRDLSQGEAGVVADIRREQRLRRRNAIIAWCLLAIGAVVFLPYGCNGGNFGNDITASMITAMWVLLPCLVVPFGWAVFAAYQAKASMDREIALMKQVPTGTPSPVNCDREAKVVRALQLVCLVVGLVILVAGFMSGGTADVLTKAINICTECIGLG